MIYENEAHSTLQKIGFGGSCHWCTEAIFQSLIGVKNVKQGWIGSDYENENLSEAIILEFDESIISLEILIEIHLDTHSCTANHSMREKYRSAVYYFTINQKGEAIKIISKLQENYKDPIVTKVIPFQLFKLNIDSQLNYYYSNPEKPFCKVMINPKLKLLLNKFNSYLDTGKIGVVS